MNFNFSEDQLLMKEEVKKLLDKENSVKRNRNVLEGEEKFDKEQKEKVWKMATSNHKESEKRAVQRGEATKTEGGKPNPYYEHIKLNPYFWVT